MTRIAAIVLAAGFSTRHAAGDKLLRDFNGAPLAAHALASVAQAPFARRLIVVQDKSNSVARLGAAAGFEIIENTNASNGIGASTAAGIAALDKNTDGAAIFLADMPLIRAGTITSLLTFWSEQGAQCVARPSYEGAIGHPVIVPRGLFHALSQLNDDTGGVQLPEIKNAARLEVDDPGVIFDVDTEEAFNAGNDY